MRKSQVAGFGTRGVVPTIVAVEALSHKARWKAPIAAPTISWGLIVKIAVVLWAMTIFAVIFWR